MSEKINGLSFSCTFENKMSETDAILANIKSKPGVLGYMIFFQNGGKYTTVKTTFSDAECSYYSYYLSPYLKKLQKTSHEIMGGPARCIRIRSYKNELIILPDQMYTLVIVQDSQVVA